VNAPQSIRIRQVLLPALAAFGDLVASFIGLAIGYNLRFHTPLGDVGIPVPNASFHLYLPLMCVGAGLLMASFGYLNVYDPRLLLRKYRSLGLLFKGTTFWLFAYLGVSLALKFDPPISRLFVAASYVTILICLHAWRSVFFALVARTSLREKLQQRVAILGCNAKAIELVEEISSNPTHPFQVIGTVIEPEVEGAFPTAVPGVPILGEVDDLSSLLKKNQIDVVLAVQLERSEGETMKLMEICEHHYVEWKVVPDAFEVFVSNLKLQTFGRIPVLGIEDFSVTRLAGRIIKRVFDLVGGLTGLVASSPIMLILALLIRRESKGPIFFRQERIGVHHRPFQIWKLRSMEVGAETSDHATQSTDDSDRRLLRIGRFMRRWNLDELPQFWNVLKGEMSLVGPRPERPFHVDQLAETIPHYMPRHLVKPGMSGWAQVNGFRGDTDLALRIQHDIYYIENWTPLLDVQIILMTFLRWRDSSFDVDQSADYQSGITGAEPRGGPEPGSGIGRPISRPRKQDRIST
jgi:exopolysaccharide biosynthesis polyprenyl glycosylphosphotransferase